MGGEGPYAPFVCEWFHAIIGKLQIYTISMMNGIRSAVARLWVKPVCDFFGWGKTNCIKLKNPGWLAESNKKLITIRSLIVPDPCCARLRSTVQKWLYLCDKNICFFDRLCEILLKLIYFSKFYDTFLVIIFICARMVGIYAKLMFPSSRSKNLCECNVVGGLHGPSSFARS